MCEHSEPAEIVGRKGAFQRSEARCTSVASAAICPLVLLSHLGDGRSLRGYNCGKYEGSALACLLHRFPAPELCLIV